MKAQAISMDLLFAVIVLLGIITVMGLVVDHFNTIEENARSQRDMEIKTQNAINSLTQTEGNPDNWEEIIANNTG